MENIVADLLQLTEEIRTAVPEMNTFEFSRYVYRPQTIEDKRNVFFVPAERLREGFLDAFRTLSPNEEIAINSRFYLKNGETRHIPMLDMAGPFDPANLGIIQSCLRDYGVERFQLFASGRSFHLYGIGSLAPEKYEKFLGRALLMNLPGKSDVVDQRWIGHRILGGYATLRWTNNSGYYKSYPQKLGEYLASGEAGNP